AVDSTRRERGGVCADSRAGGGAARCAGDAAVVVARGGGAGGDCAGVGGEWGEHHEGGGDSWDCEGDVEGEDEEVWALASRRLACGVPDAAISSRPSLREASELGAVSAT